MSTIKGGRKRAYKANGKAGARKGFQRHLRAAAISGFGNAAGGEPIRSCQPDNDPISGHHLYFGYKLQNAKR